MIVIGGSLKIGEDSFKVAVTFEKYKNMTDPKGIRNKLKISCIAPNDKTAWELTKIFETGKTDDDLGVHKKVDRVVVMIANRRDMPRVGAGPLASEEGLALMKWARSVIASLVRYSNRICFIDLEAYYVDGHYELID